MAKWPALAVLLVIQRRFVRRHYSNCRHKVNWTWCSNRFERISYVHSDHIFVRLGLSTHRSALFRMICIYIYTFSRSLKPTSGQTRNVNLQGNRFRYRFRLFTEVIWIGHPMEALGRKMLQAQHRCNRLKKYLSLSIYIYIYIYL